MNRSLLRRPPNSGTDDLLDALSTRQHLSPHEPLAQSLSHAAAATADTCPQAISQAMARLQLDPARPIGRLRRTELMQLARSIHRLSRLRSWTTATTVATAEQPSERHS
ncbi:MAG: hypothetical protein QOF78_909 [Phycisphaerales bacterium]|jgi:hypothetical protein|nr:hypothetical protein [Phycisphaerales bacterium]